MPKDLGIDWKLVEADYMRGTRLCEIQRLYSLKPGTLKTRMRRGGWATKRLALIEAMQAKAAQRSVQTLTNRASGYLERVVKQVDRGLEVLESQPPSSVKEVDAHFEALGKIDKIARPSLGLSDQGQNGKQGIINIAILQGLNEDGIVKNCQEIQTDRDAHWVKTPELAPKSPSVEVLSCESSDLPSPIPAPLDEGVEDSPPAP